MVGQTFPTEWLTDVLAAYDQVLSDLAVFVVAFVVIYLVGQMLVSPSITRIVHARNRNNPTIEMATKTYVRVLIIAFATLTGVIVAGYGQLLSDSAIIIAALTFLLGIGGQQVFGSLISGMFLVADPDFNVGDWIEWPGGEGTIEAVDFRVTRVRTANNETISIPNTKLTGNSVVRPYGRDTYRLTEQFYVAYSEDTERALEALHHVAVGVDASLGDPAPTACVVDLGENAITVEAALWIDDPMDANIHRIRSDFRRSVKRHFDEEGITLAPPSAHQLSGEVTVSNRYTSAADGV